MPKCLVAEASGNPYKNRSRNGYTCCAHWREWTDWQPICRSQSCIQNIISRAQGVAAPFRRSWPHLVGFTGNHESWPPARSKTGNEHNRRENTLPARLTFIARSDLSVICVPLCVSGSGFTDDVSGRSPATTEGVDGLRLYRVSLAEIKERQTTWHAVEMARDNWRILDPGTGPNGYERCSCCWDSCCYQIFNVGY